ncbi:MAG: PilZ domain-containing protein [Nitrospirota bacterium]
MPIDRRENVRVKDRIQVAYRFVGTEDIVEHDRPERFFPFIWNKYPQSLPLEEVEESNTKVLHHIIELHWKMDILIETVAPEKRLLVEVPKERNVCISASGIRINLDSSSLPGQRIALCIVLPFIPPANIYVIGEVIEVIEDKNYETAINFLDIRDDDREKLIRYIFKRQRDLLRDRALEKGVELHTVSEENE